MLCVKDLRECDYIVESAASTSTIHFIPDPSWDNAIVRFSDGSFKNRNNLTESLRTLNHNKLVSQHWHLVTR